MLLGWGVAIILYAPISQRIVTQTKYALLPFAVDATVFFYRNIKPAGDNKCLICMVSKLADDIAFGNGTPINREVVANPTIAASKSGQLMFVSYC